MPCAKRLHKRSRADAPDAAVASTCSLRERRRRRMGACTLRRTSVLVPGGVVKFACTLNSHAQTWSHVVSRDTPRNTLTRLSPDRESNRGHRLPQSQCVVIADGGAARASGSAAQAIGLRGNQLSELGCDVCHRIFGSTQTASRAEQGANITESFVRRVVHDRHQQVTREQRREFFVSDALSSEATQQRRGHQHDPDSRLRQSPVNFAKQWRAEGDVLLTKPNRDAT